VLLVLAACGGRPQPDDAGFHNVASAGRTGPEVVFHATVLADPQQVGDHERIEVRAQTGETLQIDHNTSLAQPAPVHTGDQVVIAGQFYDDSGLEGVHCTHAHTSSGCPYPGFIEFNGSYYE
jgi:hypothetical protein